MDTVSLSLVRATSSEGAEWSEESAAEDAVPEAKNNSDECVICYGPFEDDCDDDMQPAKLKCLHRYHYHCILYWSRRENSCPLCKSKFNEVIRNDGHVQLVEDQQQVFHGYDDGSGDYYEDENLDNYVCSVCSMSNHEDQLLLCDTPGCIGAAHTFCMALSSVPAGEWFCNACQERDAARRGPGVRSG